MKILSIVGARPNFMKIAPFVRAIEEHNSRLPGRPPVSIAANQNPTVITPDENTTNEVKLFDEKYPNHIEHVLVHTGQHYDASMSDSFFEELNIPTPDVNLGVGSGTREDQIQRTMEAFEPVCITLQPDWVVVVGDVNATIACSTVAAKLGIKVAHIEAGLRSNDLTMPEEVNRIATDKVSDLLLAPDADSVETLVGEGYSRSSIALVGNIMIDTLCTQLDTAKILNPADVVAQFLLDKQSINQFRTEGVLSEVGKASGSLDCDASSDNKCDATREDALKDNPSISYGLITLHRPANVDDKCALTEIVEWLTEVVAADMPLVWPVHPRTLASLRNFGLLDSLLEDPRIMLTSPLGYREMLCLNYHASLMVTDSGGLQEECCVLGTPFLVVRPNTERPITLIENGGIGVLAGTTVETLQPAYERVRSIEPIPTAPPLWDGHTAPRCLEAIMGYSAIKRSN